MSKSFGDILSSFKGKEDLSGILVLAEVPDLRMAIGAWQSVKIILKDNIGECNFTSDREKWEWLWSCCNVDCAQFAEFAGVEVWQGNKLFNRLKAYRLIYPDNTISTIATQYCTTIMRSHLPKAKKSKKEADK